MYTEKLKYFVNRLMILTILSMIIFSCNKTVTTNTVTTTDTNSNYSNNPLNNDTLTGYPRIKFFTVMDYGNA